VGALARQELRKKLQKLPERTLDNVFHESHERVFAETDCLQCANCCKTTSPIVRENDVSRLSVHLKQSPSNVIEKYLKAEPDGTYVMNTAPCPFLGAENYCSVYTARPAACREYPHTNRRKMHQILGLTFTNAGICPAVEKILLRLEEKLL
jgi:hypothetical protein